MKRALLITAVFTGLAGATNWARSYGTTDHEVAYNISPCSDGGYIMAGSGGMDLTELKFIKISSTGAVQWGGHGYGLKYWNYAFGIVQTSDGGYAGCGSTGNIDKRRALDTIGPCLT